MTEVAADNMVVLDEGEFSKGDATEVVSDVSSKEITDELVKEVKHTGDVDGDDEHMEDDGSVREHVGADEEEEELEEEEEELGEKLVDLPTPKVGNFNPFGDFKIYQNPLFQESSVGIEREEGMEDDEAGTRLNDTSPEEEKKELCEESRRKDEQPRHVPYSISIRDMLRFHKLAKKGEKGAQAHRYRGHHGRKRRSWSSIPPWCIPSRTTNYSPNYIPHIRFGPGKFKTLWADLYSDALSILIASFFPAKDKRKKIVINSGKKIKEKPPD